MKPEHASVDTKPQHISLRTNDSGLSKNTVDFTFIVSLCFRLPIRCIHRDF